MYTPRHTGVHAPTWERYRLNQNCLILLKVYATPDMNVTLPRNPSSVRRGASTESKKIFFPLHTTRHGKCTLNNCRIRCGSSLLKIKYILYLAKRFTIMLFISFPKMNARSGVSAIKLRTQKCNVLSPMVKPPS